MTKKHRKLNGLVKLAYIVCFAFVLASTCRLSANESLFKTNVFVSGEGGYHTYRIPSLILSQEGTLLAFCEGRKTGRGDHGDLDLLLRRSEDQGKTWKPTQVVHEEGGSQNITIGNPCPVVDQETGRIWLPFCRDNNDVFMTFSDDDGKTWAEPRNITSDVKKSNWSWYATGPGVGIQLSGEKHKGRLVIPCDHREPVDGVIAMHSHVFYSDDHGVTWRLGGSVEKHTDECQVVELADGSLMINMRNYWGTTGKQKARDKMRAVATSPDGGATWQEVRFDSGLIEPICQASFICRAGKQPNGKHQLLFSNPASKSTREKLTVRLSQDEGQTWPVAMLLHEGPSAYSCLCELPNGTIGCLYEGGKKHAYETLIFARFSMKSLTAAHVD